MGNNAGVVIVGRDSAGSGWLSRYAVPGTRICHVDRASRIHRTIGRRCRRTCSPQAGNAGPQAGGVLRRLVDRSAYGPWFRLIRRHIWLTAVAHTDDPGNTETVAHDTGAAHGPGTARFPGAGKPRGSAPCGPSTTPWPAHRDRRCAFGCGDRAGFMAAGGRDSAHGTALPVTPEPAPPLPAALGDRSVSW